MNTILPTPPTTPGAPAEGEGELLVLLGRVAEPPQDGERCFVEAIGAMFFGAWIRLALEGAGLLIPSRENACILNLSRPAAFAWVKDAQAAARTLEPLLHEGGVSGMIHFAWLNKNSGRFEAIGSRRPAYDMDPAVREFLNGYTGESRRWRALIAAYVTKIQERERQQAQTAPANE